jgi:hypothetical protein
MEYPTKSASRRLGFILVLTLLSSTLVLAQSSCPVVGNGCPPILNGKYNTFPPGTSVVFSVSGLPAGAATAVADAIAQANAVAQSLGSGITFSTTSSIGVAISNINFLGTPGAAPVLWNCGDAVSCNAQELNSSGYAVSSSIFVQLAQGCGSVACFADVGSTAFNGAIYAVLMHEMLHNLAAPDVDSDADVMGFFVGTNDVGNSAD